MILKKILAKNEGTVLQHWESHFSSKLLFVAVLLHCRAKPVSQISSSCPCLAVLASNVWETQGTLYCSLSVLKNIKKESIF